jgi:AcrR family transcriptional regulator
LNLPGKSTRDRIIESAERLFARDGIEDVSVRQINLAAGQRNPCATAYHIGSKEALLKAVLDLRRAGINRRRLALVAGIRRDGREREVGALVEALIHPLAELLPPADGGAYLRVTAQAIGHPRYHLLVRGDHGEGLNEVLSLLRASLPGIPREILDQRFGMALRQVFHELADYQRVHGSRRAGALPDPGFFIGNLVDSVAGLFAAPVSAATSHELRRNRRRTA